MIVSFFIYLLYLFLLLLTAPFRLLSDTTAPSWLTDTFTAASSYLAMGFQWLPKMTWTVLLTWGVSLVILGLIFGYRGVMWIIKKIPGIG